MGFRLDLFFHRLKLRAVDSQHDETKAWLFAFHCTVASVIKQLIRDQEVEVPSQVLCLTCFVFTFHDPHSRVYGFGLFLLQNFDVFDLGFYLDA